MARVLLLMALTAMASVSGEPRKCYSGSKNTPCTKPRYLEKFLTDNIGLPALKFKVPTLKGLGAWLKHRNLRDEDDAKKALSAHKTDILELFNGYQVREQTCAEWRDWLNPVLTGVSADRH